VEPRQSEGQSLVGDRRKLAAIVAVDVAGYSRLMGRDESGTLLRLREHRKARLEPIVANYGGRLVKLVGDGALVEFSSAVGAVSAAVAFQQAMIEANEAVPEESAVVFRIGVHLGDVIVEDDDLYGDGVNVAARLEAEAPAGGIVVSGNVHDAVTAKLKARFCDMGDRQLKNIGRPVRAYGVEWAAGDWKTTVATLRVAGSPQLDVPLTLPDKPSIAVLPFHNMSGDPEQEYFVDGLVEDIITALSRFKSLFVSARNSSFSYKGKSPDTRLVGRELGVRYVVEGSIRRTARRIRVTAQLVDSLTGSHIWAEHFDRVLEDVFAVQEEITNAIVGEIAPQIELTERAKANRPRPDNLTAYEIAVRAWAHQLEGRNKAERPLIEQAIQEAREALAIDPTSARALHALARAQGTALFLQFAPDREKALQEANWAAARAVELDPTDAFGYAQRGILAMLGGQFDRYPDALMDARRAHEMNPNDTFILRIVGDLEAGAGEPERALEHLHEVLRLSPRDPHRHITCSTLAFASFAAKQYEEGMRWASRALNDMPGMLQAHCNLAICCVGAGAIDRAKAAFKKGEELSHEFFKVRLEGKWQYARQEDRERATTFLRVAAGLGEPAEALSLR
jgi:adenylate cyclase